MFFNHPVPLRQECTLLKLIDTLEISVCIQRKPLGLSTGRIPSTNISSSTSFNSNQNFEYAPSQVRFNTASSWCGSDNGTWKSDWLQVDFGEQVNLTGIAVQGIHDKPEDILAEFHLQMSDDGVEFRNQTDSDGKIKVNLEYICFTKDVFYYSKSF